MQDEHQGDIWIIKAFSVISVPSVVGLKYAVPTALDLERGYITIWLKP